MKKSIKVLLSVLLLCSACLLAVFIFEKLTQQQTTKKTPAEFTYWNGCESLTALKEYLVAVTEPAGEDFISPVDRIAVFDLDGTLVGEQFPIYFEWMMYCQRVLNDTAYTPTNEQTKLAGDILTAAKARTIPDGLEEREHTAFGDVFAGMTNSDFKEYVRNFLQTDADGFSGLKLSDAYFRPMTEVVDALKANDFIVYIVSGTDRDCDRVMIADVLNLPYRQIIGSDYYSRAAEQGGKAYLDYQFAPDDTVVRSSQSIIKNVKMSKVVQMAQELGQQPVLAFGNNSGDKSMFMYTTYHNTYRAADFCLIPDDNEREYAYPQKAESLNSMCGENGWHPISMKNDFKTIYADGVQKKESNSTWADMLLDRYDDAIALDKAA